MNSEKAIDLLNNDAAHIWHPYSGAPAAISPHLVESAQGTKIHLHNGNELIDGMASWWAVIHGYNHPELNNALTIQLNKMSHIMFGGLTHEPAILLAKKLSEITPEGLTRVFFSDSGSVAVEVAIKMAVQYWHSLGYPEKKKILTIRKGYHGDTFGAMSVCDPVNGMHHLFQNNLMEQIFIDEPQCRNDSNWHEEQADELYQSLAENKDEIAAVILEPIVQGAGGMRFYCPEFLRKIRQGCDQYDTLLIADEIATGFGRTGKMFACEHADITPDILCLGKSLTAGYLTLAATMTNEEITNIISTKGNKMLMHGPTYMANPLACSVALASIKILEGFSLARRINNIENLLLSGLNKCSSLAHVKDVRVLGAIGVIETHDPVDVQKIQDSVIENGVWLRPFNNLIYTMPPFIISDIEIKKITDAVYQALISD
jgi:adenosylmethionine---8-amino-7-oxononanoate aminotransferase